MKFGSIRRREAALERLDARGERSPSQQLAELDRRLGAGVGAARERNRLHAIIGGVLKPPKKEKKSKG